MLNKIPKETRCCLFAVLVSRVRYSCTIGYEIFCIRGNGNKLGSMQWVKSGVVSTVYIYYDTSYCDASSSLTRVGRRR